MELPNRNCPRVEELLAFLADESATVEATALDCHVQTCLACQTALDRLTTEPLPIRLPMVPHPGSTRLRSLRNTPPTRDGQLVNRPETTSPWIPGYEIVRELGRGGSGLVYLAWDTKLRRSVAVKVILDGVHAAPNEIARFHADSLAVAEINHPHIVHVYQVGKYAGLHFCVMEYLSGGNLRKRMADHPTSASEAGELVQQIARTMHDVHTAGFIHRDLKPENVLFDADGVPKIVDFGLALRLSAEPGATRLTATGDLLGTPSYMAPEQVAGSDRIGPACDVYALGVILYELLTGRRPFQGPGTRITFSQILEQEPTNPRRLNPAVPKDLETICLRCLQKEPHRRYTSARDLADDLRRALDGRPILARPVGSMVRMWLWARRNPWPAIRSALLSGSVLTLAIGGPIAAYHQSQLAESLRREKAALVNANIREQAARETAQAHAASARGSAALARRTADDLLAMVGDDLLFIEDIRTVKQKSLAVALDVYRQFRGTPTDDEARIGVALTQLRIGTLYLEVGNVPTGITSLRDGVSRLGNVVGEDPTDAGLRRELARGHFRLGLALDRTGQATAARNEIARATALLKTLPADPHALESRQARARVLRYRGYMTFYSGSVEEAETVLRASLDEAAPLAAEWPTENTRWVLGKTQCDLGVTRLKQGDAVEAESLLVHSLETLGHLLAEFPNDLHRADLANARYHLAEVIAESRPAEALPIVEKAVAAWFALSRPRRDWGHWSDEGISRILLGRVLEKLGRPADAEVQFREAAHVFEQLLAAQPLNFGHVLNFVESLDLLAGLRAAADGPEAGLRVIEPAVRAVEPVFREMNRKYNGDESSIVNVCVRRACLLTELDRHAEAANEWGRAAQRAKVGGRSSLRAHQSLSVSRAGDHDAAISLARDVGDDTSLPDGIVVELARVYARALGAAKNDGERATRAAWAVTMLRRAYGESIDIAAISKDPDFVALVGREEFRTLGRKPK